MIGGECRALTLVKANFFRSATFSDANISYNTVQSAALSRPFPEDSKVASPTGERRDFAWTVRLWVRRKWSEWEHAERPESGKGAFRRSHFLILIKELEYQTNSRTAPGPFHNRDQGGGSGD